MSLLANGKGYISASLFDMLFQDVIHIVTGIKSNPIQNTAVIPYLTASAYMLMQILPKIIPISHFNVILARREQI
jgi:hypothetical protein